MVAPCFCSDWSRAKHFLWKASSPTDNASSTIRMSGLITACTAKAKRRTIPLEYVFVGCSMKSPMSAKVAISSNFASVSSLDRPRMGAKFMCRHIFMTVKSRLNPIPVPAVQPLSVTDTTFYGGLERSRDDLQRRGALRSRSVPRCPRIRLSSLERNISQRKEVSEGFVGDTFAEVARARWQERHLTNPSQHRAMKTSRGRGPDGVTFPQIFDFDNDVGVHTSKLLLVTASTCVILQRKM